MLSVVIHVKRPYKHDPSKGMKHVERKVWTAIYEGRTLLRILQMKSYYSNWIKNMHNIH